MRAGPLCELCVAVGVVCTCGCINVGPKYVRPDGPVPPEFKEASAAAYARLPPGTWKPARPQDAALKGKWWEMFDEPELDALEERLDINNQTIAQYFQNFMAARAQVDIARAGYFPTWVESVGRLYARRRLERGLGLRVDSPRARMEGPRRATGGLGGGASAGAGLRLSPATPAAGPSFSREPPLGHRICGSA